MIKEKNAVRDGRGFDGLQKVAGLATKRNSFDELNAPELVIWVTNREKCRCDPFGNRLGIVPEK